MVGLTGTIPQINHVARTYRVYFSPISMSDTNADDYLVDHSIFYYLMDPQGKFVDCYGHNGTVEDSTASIARHMRTWRPEQEEEEEKKEEVKEEKKEEKK